MSALFGTRRTARHAVPRCAVLLVALAVSPLLHAAGPAGCGGRTFDDAGLGNAWRTLRVVDCARCHGKDYEGLAAPSIIGYVRTQSRARFDYIVLEGDPPRGMPGYRRNVLIAAAMDDLYRYFAGRAAGEIGPGAPCGKTAAARAPAPGTRLSSASHDAGKGGDRRPEEGLAVREPERP